ncbi:MAG TPA: MFS transporter [Caulobacterales bacterium]|nr:MFS transporter [Caulobacterales bacterium]
MTANAGAPDKKKYGLRETVKALGQPRVAAMFALGFGSGLPFLLTGATFGYWLRDEGTSLTAIGFLSWVGLAYTFKFFWAPIIDRLPAPLFGKLGRRRGWVVFTQVLIGLTLVAMAAVGVHGPGGLTTIGALALIVAVASASQDTAVDAWRIEAASDGDELGLFTSAFQLGYRVALLLTDAIILVFAQYMGWPISYVLMAVAMGVGLFAAFKTPEPPKAEAAMDANAKARPLWTPRGFFDAVVGPFFQFFRAHGPLALILLLMIALYRLPEFLIGPVAGPFYHDLGLEKATVGAIRGSIGLVASVAGIAAGGVCVVRLGYVRTLVIGALLQGLGVAAYAMVATYGADLRLFGGAMAWDNFCYAFAGVALVTYMSSLTNLGYTATQYALMSSMYAFVGKVLKGYSGAVVDWLSQHGHTLMQSYAMFYVGAGAVCLPAFVLCIFLAMRTAKLKTETPAPA